MSLTTAVIEKAQPGITPDGRMTAKSYKMGDSAGLYLLVSPAGGKWWRLKKPARSASFSTRRVPWLAR
jgi:hypothetical protein